MLIDLELDSGIVTNTRISFVKYFSTLKKIQVEGFVVPSKLSHTCSVTDFNSKVNDYI